MTRAAAEFEALTAALEHQEPACADDWRYTVDVKDLDPFAQTDMKSICRTCPLVTKCATYARKARPPAGMWAGTYYSAKKENA